MDTPSLAQTPLDKPIAHKQAVTQLYDEGKYLARYPIGLIDVKPCRKWVQATSSRLGVKTWVRAVQETSQKYASFDDAERRAGLAADFRLSSAAFWQHQALCSGDEILTSVPGLSFLGSGGHPGGRGRMLHPGGGGSGEHQEQHKRSARQAFEDAEDGSNDCGSEDIQEGEEEEDEDQDEDEDEDEDEQEDVQEDVHLIGESSEDEQPAKWPGMATAGPRQPFFSKKPPPKQLVGFVARESHTRAGVRQPSSSNTKLFPSQAPIPIVETLEIDPPGPPRPHDPNETGVRQPFLSETKLLPAQASTPIMETLEIDHQGQALPDTPPPSDTSQPPQLRTATTAQSPKPRVAEHPPQTPAARLRSYLAARTAARRAGTDTPEKPKEPETPLFALSIDALSQAPSEIRRLAKIGLCKVIGSQPELKKDSSSAQSVSAMTQNS